VTSDQRTAERRAVVALLAQPDGAVLLRYLRRRWRDAATAGESEHQMLNRLGRLDALADLERLREEAKGD
jgi:hypothetical protein